MATDTAKVEEPPKEQPVQASTKDGDKGNESGGTTSKGRPVREGVGFCLVCFKFLRLEIHCHVLFLVCVHGPNFQRIENCCV